MADRDSASLSLGKTIARRYRVDATPAPGSDSTVHPGSDTESHQLVRIVVVDGRTAEQLGKLVDIDHPHLARLLAVETGAASCVVEEQVEGISLDERLRQGGPPPPVDAVRNVLRLANVVSVLHEHGVVHGELVPRAVLLHPKNRPEPVLRRAGMPSLPAGYARPERDNDAQLSVADDAWALAGLLYELLTGAPPPARGLASVAAISEETVPHESLRSVLAAYLSERPADRMEDLHHLQHVLARWYVDHVGEEAAPSTCRPHAHHTPPPLPPSLEPRRVSRPPAAQRRPYNRRWAVVLLGASGVVLGLGAAWTYSSLHQSAAVPAGSASPATVATQAPSAIDLGEVPVTGRSNERARDQRASCVAGYLPHGALRQNADLSWLCSVADARAGAERLKGLVGGPLKLGWYWIPAYAVARTACCTDSSPLTLSEPSPGCKSALESVRNIAHRVVAAQPSSEAVDRFTRAVECEIKAGRGELFGKGVAAKGGPTDEERRAFGAMLEQLAQP
ncbi:MAG: protein kinase [Polyangiaceae bacterium]|nr:protein kinase [Polyangiaceae bacterium]